MGDALTSLDLLGGLAQDLGPIGLFVASFLAATVLPFTSEAALVAAVASGMDMLQALVFASAGNSLACLVNYGMGHAGGSLLADRIRSSRVGALAWHVLHRHGWLALLVSWTPVIGDPITVLAGFARLPLPLFAAIVLPLRVLRYVIILWGMRQMASG